MTHYPRPFAIFLVSRGWILDRDRAYVMIRYGNDSEDEEGDDGFSRLTTIVSSWRREQKKMETKVR